MASRVSAVSSEWGPQSSIMTSQTIHRPTLEDRMTDFKLFCYNPALQTFFGKTIVEWAFIIAYHLIFYIFLFLGLAGLLGIFYLIVDWNYPTMQKTDSILKVPGVSFRPMPFTDSTVIRFVKGDASTYTQYLDHLEAYLRYYENDNQRGENYIDCSDITERRTTRLDKVCRFNMEWLGANCVKEQNFGFDDGQPCILLKLNKIFDWQPEEYTKENVPEEIQNDWSTWSIKVTCEGENAVDKENMGPILYFPSDGFHFKYFPFRNQQGYRSPLIFVRFDEPTPGILLMVTCKVWAKNIYHDKNEMSGQVHFELLVD